MDQEILQKHLWINNTLFEKLLQKQHNDETIFVKTFQVVQTSTRTQSYWCDILRVLVNFTCSSNVQKSQNIVLKIAFYDPYMEESVEKYDPFKREIFFHKNLMPKITELMLTIGDKNEITNNVLNIVNVRPQPKYLVFEDVPVKYYRKIDHKLGFDATHLKLILSKLALLHASTAVLYQKEKELFAHHQEPNMSEYFKIFHLLFLNCVHLLANEISTETWGDAPQLAKKLYAFERNMIERASEAFMLEDGEFGVLNHGDLWLKNILLQYNDDGSLVDTKLTDFGLSYFGSPGIDLTYLIFSSTNDEINDYEIDKALQHYHRELHAKLIQFNYSLQIPTLTQIHNHFLKCGIIGVIYSFLLLPFRYRTNVSLENLSRLLKDTEATSKLQNQLFQDTLLKKKLRFLLCYFDRKGLLD